MRGKKEEKRRDIQVCQFVITKPVMCSILAYIHINAFFLLMKSRVI